jgi:hypothetical protein
MDEVFGLFPTPFMRAPGTLGPLTLRLAPVEACIALSIVLVASEALRGRDTLARRLPALVSFLSAWCTASDSPAR